MHVTNEGVLCTAQMDANAVMFHRISYNVLFEQYMLGSQKLTAAYSI